MLRAAMKAPDKLATLERNPGVTEATVRSDLRREFGASSALDVALTDGVMIRRGHKLYRREDAPRAGHQDGES